MKTIFNIIGIFLLVFIILYLSMSFISLDFNVINWSRLQREVFIVLGFFFSILTSMLCFIGEID